MIPKNRLLNGVFLTAGLIPVVLLLLWHGQNAGVPTGDGMAYMLTSLELHDAIIQKPGGTLFHLLNIRGGRPIMFPILGVLPLLASGGEVMQAVAWTQISLYLAAMIWIFFLFRIMAPTPHAVVGTLLLFSSPWMMSYGLIYYPELAWIALFAGLVYHLHQAQGLTRVGHVTLAALLLGLMICLRPVETTVFLLPCLLPVLLIQRVTLSWRSGSVLLVLGVATVVGQVLVDFLTTFQEVPATRLQVVAGTVLMLVAPLIAWPRWPISNPTRFTAITLLLPLGWFLPFLSQTFNWAYQNSFGVTAGFTDQKEATTGLLQGFVTILVSYPPWLLLSSLVLILSAAWWQRWRRQDPIPLLLVMGGGIFSLAAIMYHLTATNDPRRLLLGVVALLLAATLIGLAWPGRIGHAIRILMVATVAVHTTQGMLLLLELPIPSWMKHLNTTMPSPQQTDYNLQLLQILQDYGLNHGIIAVQSHALREPHRQIYQVDSLILLSHIHKMALSFNYNWGVADPVKAVAIWASFAQAILLDDDQESAMMEDSRAYHRFTTALMRGYHTDTLHLYGLTILAEFQLAGRRQVLMGFIRQ